jgi:hypothetical protein
LFLVEGGGFEPPKAEPSDLQSDPFDHSGTPPKMQARYCVAEPVRCQQQIMDLRHYLPAEKHQALQGCRLASNSYTYQRGQTHPDAEIRDLYIILCLI